VSSVFLRVKMTTDKLQTVRDTLIEILSKPSSPPTFFDEEPAPHTLSNPPDEPAVETSVARSPSDTDSDTDNAVTAEQAKSLLAELGIDTVRKTLTAILGETSAPPSLFDKEPAPQSFSDKRQSEEPGVEPAMVDPPTDARRAVRSAKQAKSLLAGLDMYTEIRLRWAMRDIRGKRTKMSPVSEKDLATLIDLGFVEMREGNPALTEFGVSALD
jgi:hypothetical protein